MLKLTVDNPCIILNTFIYFYLFTYSYYEVMHIAQSTVQQSARMRPLLIERCVGLREGSGVERPCAMIFTLLGL